MVIVCLPELVFKIYPRKSYSYMYHGIANVEYDSYAIDENYDSELLYSESYGTYEICD